MRRMMNKMDGDGDGDGAGAGAGDGIPVVHCLK